MTEGQSKHGASMRQVNPNKTFAGEYKPQYYASYTRNNA